MEKNVLQSTYLHWDSDLLMIGRGVREVLCLPSVLQHPEDPEDLVVQWHLDILVNRHRLCHHDLPCLL